MKTPQEWSEYFGVQILDRDGWRSTAYKDFEEPIDELEFLERLLPCTVEFHNMLSALTALDRYKELSSEGRY